MLELLTPEEAVKKTKGTLVSGSDVLVYSLGPLPMLFSWCFASRDAPYVTREMHQTSSVSADNFVPRKCAGVQVHGRPVFLS